MTPAPDVASGDRSASLADRSTAYMLVGTLVAAAAAYAFTLLGSRVLGPDRYAPVAVLWTIQFLLVTVVLLPAEQLVIRQLTLRAHMRDTYLALAGLGVGSALVIGAFTAGTLDSLFRSDASFIVTGAGLGIGYTGFALARGRLAGAERFDLYATVTASESLFRLAVAAAALSIGMGALALTGAMVLAPLVALPWLRAGRHAQPVQVPSGGVRRFIRGYVSGNAAAQTLLAAGPLAAFAIGASAAEVSVIAVTMTLFRLPLTISYNLLARVTPRLIDALERGGAAAANGLVRTTIWSAAAAGLVGAATAWPLVPAIVVVMFGRDFEPSSALTAMLAFGLCLAFAALVVQHTLVAVNRTGELARAWMTALAIGAALVVWLPADVQVRVGSGFAAGNLAASVLLARTVLQRAAASEHATERAT